MTAEATLDRAYAAKDPDYFGRPRREWIDPLPADRSLKVLELGCGDGATGAEALAAGKCGLWIGIERQGKAAERARARLSEVIVGDIDSLELSLPPGSFDLLVMGEVLEHLPDPEKTLTRLVRLLKPGGWALASTPNVAHWRIVAGLIAGRFDYEDEGVMDRTHLKWFTPRSLARAFEAAGLVGVEVRPLGWKPRSQTLTAAMPLRHLLWRQIEARGVRA
ncbi:MAG TPA: class I SAM-dependent methyltransferase [Caulobacteraceae bacterium]